MRTLLLFLVFVLSGVSFSQNTNEIPVTNNSMNTPASIQQTEQDTLNNYEKQIDTKAVSKKSKVQTEKKYSVESDEMTKSELADQSQISSVSTSFSAAKQISSTQRTQRTPSSTQQEQMDSYVSLLEKSAPESFEYHYFKYIAGNYNVDLIDHLKKAEVLKPNNSDVQIQMAAYYLIINDPKSALTYLQKLVQSTRLNKEVLDYARDLLLSAPDNGTLITHGFDDTYAVAYLQLSDNVRTDVQLISLDFLQSAEYKQKLQHTGYKIPERSVVDVQFFTEFCFQNSHKLLGISLTTPKEYLKGIEQNIFVTGLVFEYHSELNYSNFYRNDYLWNEVLQKTVIDSAMTEKAKQLSSNYLPMLLYLRKTYAQAGEKEKVAEIDKALDKVAIQSKKYDQVQKLKSNY